MKSKKKIPKKHKPKKLLNLEKKGVLFLHQSIGNGEFGKHKFEFGVVMPHQKPYVFYRDRYCTMDIEAFVKLAIKKIDKSVSK